MTKYLKSFLLFVLMALSSHVFAHDFKNNGIYYVILPDWKSVSVTNRDGYYNSYAGDVVIPETVTYNGNTYTVRGIYTNAFRGSYNLTSLVIPKTVTGIGNNAFYGCSRQLVLDIYCDIGAESFKDYEFSIVRVHEGVTQIGAKAFSNCTLGAIVFWNTIKTIGEDAFEKCSVSEVGILDIASWCNISFKNQYSNPLWNCNIAKDYSSGEIGGKRINDYGLKIPESVKRISDYAFYSFDGLTSVEIPNTVESIGDYAFYDCKNLSSVNIPNSVIDVGKYSFNGCIYEA